jgi:hypothetical protein
MSVPMQSPYVTSQFRNALRLRSAQGRLYRRHHARTTTRRPARLARVLQGTLVLGLAAAGLLLAWLGLGSLATTPSPPCGSDATGQPPLVTQGELQYCAGPGRAPLTTLDATSSTGTDLVLDTPVVVPPPAAPSPSREPLVLMLCSRAPTPCDPAQQGHPPVDPPPTQHAIKRDMETAGTGVIPAGPTPQP